MRPDTSQHLLFPAADGTSLEGVLHLPAGSGPFPAAVVCHPHPLMGGDMHNPIVVTVCQTLLSRGWVALRFNFRGKGESKGTFDDGIAEMHDVGGALDLLSARDDVDQAQLAVVGYSFGAQVGLRHTAQDPRVIRLAGIALTQGNYDDPFLDNDSRPKLFVVGERDAWAPRPSLEAYVERLPPPKQLHVIPNTDHFFGGHEGEVGRLIANWLNEPS